MMSYKKMLKTLFTSRQGIVGRRRYVPIIILMLATFAASSQDRRTLDRSIYQKVLRPDLRVKVQTIDNGRIIKTDTSDVNNILVPVDEKKVISYKKEILPIDAVTYKRLSSISSLSFTKTDLKVIPELYIESKDSGSKEIAYQLYFFPYQSFQYNNGLKKFSAKMGFFLAKLNSENESVDTIQPVNVEVVSNEVESIRPRPLEITHLSFPTSDVELVGDQLSDSVRIKVITASNPNGYTTSLPVRPSLEIFTNRSSFEGFGIQKIPVEVRFVGSNSSDSVKVNFSVEKGSINPNTVYVRYNSPATVYLSSEGMGKTKLSAISNNISSNDLEFTYVFPWFFLLASILGGLIGGFAKYYLNNEEKKFSIRPIIGGILIGFIGAVAYYALGINLLGLSLSAGQNEIAVLGLSALCAYFGISRKTEAV